MQDMISISAPDKYTVVFKFKTPNPEFIMETLHNVGLAQCLENPDVVKKCGDAADWHHAVGTGPFILKDFISGEYLTLDKILITGRMTSGIRRTSCPMRKS